MGVEASRRHGDIQGLRALAVLAVVVYHAVPEFLPGGFVGVDVFFVISGFVIAASLLRELDQTGTVSLRSFFLRRVRRLLPAFAVMIAVVGLLAVGLAPLGGQNVTASTGVAAALFNANTYLATLQAGYFDAGLELNALLHTWSLSVEEQFYLAFPVLVLGGWRIAATRVSGRTGVTAVLLLVGAVSLTLSLWLTYVVDAEQWAFYLAPARAWEFVAGAMLALAAPAASPMGRRVGTPLAAVGLLLVAGSAVVFDASTVFPGWAALVPVGGAVLLLLAGQLHPDGPISAALACSPAQWLGDLSYGWYLWHWPAIVFAAAWFPQHGPWVTAAAAGASLLPAMVSHRLVEEPVRRVPRPRVVATLRLAVVCVGVALAASFVLDTAEREGIADDVADAFGHHVDVSLGCGSRVPLGERDMPQCDFGAADADLDVVVIGDSQAGHLTAGVLAGVAGDDVRVTAASFSACAFLDLRVDDGVNDGARCRSFVDRSMAGLLERRPDVVVISSASDIYLHRSRLRMPEGGSPIDAPAERIDAWSDALGRTVGALQQAGIGVVLVHPAPRVDLDWDPRDCAVGLLRVAPERCAQSEDEDDARAWLADAYLAERAVADEFGVPVIDLVDEICEDECAALTDQGWILRDGRHLTVAASERLGPRFADVLSA